MRTVTSDYGNQWPEHLESLPGNQIFSCSANVNSNSAGVRDVWQKPEETVLILVPGTGKELYP
jgi:hypothetical protein